MNLLSQTLLSLVATAITIFCLVLFVSLQKVKSDVKWTFVLYSFCISTWSSGQALALYLRDHDLSLLAVRLCHVGVVLIPVFFVHFIHSLLGTIGLKAGIIKIFYAIGFVFLLSDATSLLVKDVSLRRQPFFYIFDPGIFYPWFLLFWFIAVVYGGVELYKGYSTSTGIRRDQLKYFFWGTLFAYIGGVPNFLFGYDIIVPGLMPFGTYTLPIYVGVTAYAIVRHGFMDIEVIVKRTLVFAGLAGSVVAVVSLMTFVSQDLLARFIVIPKWLANVLAAALIAALYGPVRSWLVNVTDRYLFQKKYDYKQLLKTFTDEVVTVLDLRNLVEQTVERLVSTIKLDACGLLLLNKDRRSYDLVASRGTNGRHLALEEREPLITFLHRTGEPIAIDGGSEKIRFPEAVTGRLKELNARLALPLALHEELIGVLCLGKKKSDEEWTKDDLDILLPLARTLAIAISNAQLFDELAKTQAEAAQREKLAVIGTLSAGINHEICNPLGIVKAQCEAFLLDKEDGILVGKSPGELLDRTSTILRVALKQIDRATAITQKLSNFAKPIKEPSVEPVSVAREVDEVLILVGHDLALEKIGVVKDVQPDLPPIVVDRRQFQEVLFNLLRNAGQAITPPGTITVSASWQDGRVRVAIADTGAGIPPDKLEKIYDPFFTTKEPGKGTGLGLFIVRQIVERNKGRISVDSAVGRGTTFFLEFPAGQPSVVAT